MAYFERKIINRVYLILTYLVLEHILSGEN